MVLSARYFTDVLSRSVWATLWERVAGRPVGLSGGADRDMFSSCQGRVWLFLRARIASTCLLSPSPSFIGRNFLPFILLVHSVFTEEKIIQRLCHRPEMSCETYQRMSATFVQEGLCKCFLLKLKTFWSCHVSSEEEYPVTTQAVQYFQKRILVELCCHCPTRCLWYRSGRCTLASFLLWRQ